MLAAPIPQNEAQRLAALFSCGVLDTAPEAAFDDVVQLASHLCEVPIALVSLVDHSRQWFKAKVGLTDSETPRECALCAHAILSTEPLIVTDTWLDPRFADNPLVTGAPFVRFYAGMPLALDDGSVLGTLCVIDHVPRQLQSTQLDMLRLLARRVATELNLRRRLRDSSLPPLAPSAAPTRHEPVASGTHATALPVPLGSVVGERYRIERVLGVGGMGVVTAAHDLVREQPVALKLMRPGCVTQQQAVERFVREARALLALDDPHIAKVLDVGNLDAGAPFIVLEYLEGDDLATLLVERGRLAVDEAVGLVRQACLAVKTAHEHGILHRDLKPANLFVVRGTNGEPIVKVLDFGISKLMDRENATADTALTGAEVTLGSPEYMSPDQMLSAADVDERTDIWSLGVVLYELLVGRSPFRGASSTEVFAKVLTQPLEPIDAARPDVPPALAHVVMRCLERDRTKRYPHVGDLLDALAEIPTSAAAAS